MKLSKPEIIAIVDFMEEEGFHAKRAKSGYYSYDTTKAIGGIEVTEYYGNSPSTYSARLFGNDIETSKANIKWLWDYCDDGKNPTDKRLEELKEEFLRKGLSSIID